MGYAIIDTSDTENLPRLIKVKYMHLTAPKIGDRLHVLMKRLEKEIEDEMVELICFEDGVFRGANGPALNYVAGLFHLLAAIYEIPIRAPKPTEIKKVICGSGKADKKEVEKAVMTMLSNPPDSFETDHSSDATAIALYGNIKYVQK